MRLKRSFFARSTLVVAKDLLGRTLVRKINGKELKGKIVETEAYCGPKDKASHVYGGKKTERNKVVFGKSGLIYIYLCYGIHWQMNITSGGERPECVLIRALEPLDSDGIEANGPGKLTKWLKLDKDFYGEDLVKSKRIWLTKGKKVDGDEIASGPRIGIDYAGQWAEKRWRFFIRDNKFVSGK